MDRPRSDNGKWSVLLHDATLGRTWLIAASSAAFSDTHMDAAGYATAVRIEGGSKLWLTQCNLEDYADRQAQREEEDRAEYCAIHLRPGDLL